MPKYGMTAEEKVRYLSPSHDHFELVLDPWHKDAFAGTPIAGFGNGGTRRKNWYSVDWCGNLIQYWGREEDCPPERML